MAQKAIVWTDGAGTPCYASSAFGGCLRALVLARIGYEQQPPPPSLLKVFNAGHDAEDRCVETLTSRGWNIYNSQDEVALRIETKFGVCLVLGHIDGEYDTYEMVGPEDGLVAAEGIIEIKSQGKSAWDKYELHGASGDLWERYEWQAAIYMIARNRPLTWVRWLRDAEEPTYAMHSITEPPHSLEEITQRIETVEECAREGMLPPCDIERWGCPYSYMHENQQKTDAVEIVGLEALCSKYEKYRREEVAAKAEKDRIRSRIIEVMGDEERGSEGNAKVTIFDQARKSLDEKAMAADGIDVEKYRVERKSKTVKVIYEP